MKKTVLTFGLIAGAIMSIMMFATVPFVDRIGFDKGVYIGYTTMVAGFLLVFFGIRSYRDNVGDGKISFGRAFLVGILITLIACLCYVIAWEILYQKFLPDFLEQYSSYEIQKLRASGATEQAINKSLEDMSKFKEMYANPFIRAAVTLLEPLPVGLLVALISSAVLRKK